MAEPATAEPTSSERDPTERRAVVRVSVDPQGPTYVEGPVELCVDGGEPVLIERFRVAICSCRCSKSYPLCDGTHNRTRRRVDRTV